MAAKIPEPPTLESRRKSEPEKPERKLKVGDKVRIKSKSVGCDLTEHDIHLKYPNGIGYILEIRGDPNNKQNSDSWFLVSSNLGSGLRYCFLFNDLEFIESFDEEGETQPEVKDERKETQPKETMTTETKNAPEEQANAILFWYLEEILEKKKGNYPLINHELKIESNIPLTKEDLDELLVQNTIDSTRVAIRELGVYLYEMLTGHSERTDISFCLDGYPDIRIYVPSLSMKFAQIVHQMISGFFRDAETLRKALDNENQATEAKPEKSKKQNTKRPSEIEAELKIMEAEKIYAKIC